MSINSQRANAIQAYIDSKKDSIKKGKQKVEISGKIELLDSFMIPTSLLLYNRGNRRFRLEMLEHEATIGRQLNPGDQTDVAKIKEFLLQDSTEAEKLYDDLKLLGEQREVAAVTHDGIVINGNRRMATLEKLNKDEPTGKWSDFWVVRLPPTISEADLWKIEAGLQLSKQKVADYGPINDLLMIKEGKMAKLQPDEIAAAMYGWTEKQVILDLERLDLIDIFLDFMGQAGNYGLIKALQLNEHFIDIQKGIIEKLKQAGAPRKKTTQYLENVFVFLKASIDKPDIFSITHMEMRKLCKMMFEPKPFDTLVDGFDKHKDIKKVPAEKLADNFDKAIDLTKNLADQSKPGKLIDRAIGALNGINRKDKHYKTDQDVKSKLKSLSEIVNTMKKELGIK